MTSRAAVAVAVLLGVVPLTASARPSPLAPATRRAAPAVTTPLAAAPTVSRAPEVSRHRRPPLPAGANNPGLLRLAAATDIPPRALFAYQDAAARYRSRDRSCGLEWEFLAAFGRMETDHGRLGGSSIGPDAVARPAIVGPPLDGSKPGVIGRLADASGAAVRAAGPLQFIPDTWKRWGSGNVQNIDRAASAAARYLCADGRDLSTPAGRHAAALAYNNVGWYAIDVLAVYADYLARRPAHSFPVKPGGGAPAPGVTAKRSPATLSRAAAPAPAGASSSARSTAAAARRSSATPAPAPAPRRTSSAATTPPRSPSTSAPSSSSTPSSTASP